MLRTPPPPSQGALIANLGDIVKASGMLRTPPPPSQGLAPLAVDVRPVAPV